MAIYLAVVAAPILLAIPWVIFNIQKPAREQWSRDFGGGN